MNDNYKTEDELLLEAAQKLADQHKSKGLCIPCPLMTGGPCPLLASAVATMKGVIKSA